MGRRDDPDRAHQLKRWRYRQRYGPGMTRPKDEPVQEHYRTMARRNARTSPFAAGVAQQRHVSDAQAAALRRVEDERRKSR